MSSPITYDTIKELIRTNIIKKTHERIGKRPFEQNVIRFDNKRFQLTKKMVNGTKPSSNDMKKAIRDLLESISSKSVPLVGIAKTMRANRALKSYAIKTKATVSPTESHFNNYSNAVSISNIKLKGLKGLSYLKYEYGRFHKYLNDNPGMSLIVVANVAFRHQEEPELRYHDVRSRRYNITNVNQLLQIMNSIAQDIQLAIENQQFERSGLYVELINELTIMYSVYDPTRAGPYIKLPKWVEAKKIDDKH